MPVSTVRSNRTVGLLCFGKKEPTNSTTRADREPGKAPLEQRPPWVKIDKIGKVFLKKPRVGFGSLELSLRLSCTEFCPLSSGHGPRGEGFYGGSLGGDFCILWGSQMEKDMKIEDEIG